ncbi:hypothetical protein DFH06DRAFT_1202255 [Mycena polygramma]|nr:hypothetical protein DFH06DRAFT_1214085 [Mycena polygramma]KAJ7654390.1 hypothetical protein DFH06DRAFT_1202255 [Mycena polygramma]
MAAASKKALQRAQEIKETRISFWREGKVGRMQPNSDKMLRPILRRAARPGIRHLSNVRPGKLLLIDTIDISGAAQRTEHSEPKSAPTPAPSTHRHSSTRPIAVDYIIKQLNSPGPSVVVDANPVGFNLFGWTAVAVALLSLLVLLLRIAKDLEKRVAELRRFLADAPDLAELRQNDDAMAAHLNALVPLALDTAFNNQHFQQTLARLRTEGDTGRAVIAEFCSRLHKIILAETIPIEKPGYIHALYASFVAEARANGSKAPAEGAASTDFSDAFELPDDYTPPLSD